MQKTGDLVTTKAEVASNAQQSSARTRMHWIQDGHTATPSEFTPITAEESDARDPRTHREPHSTGTAPPTAAPWTPSPRPSHAARVADADEHASPDTRSTKVTSESCNAYTAHLTHPLGSRTHLPLSLSLSPSSLHHTMAQVPDRQRARVRVAGSHAINAAKEGNDRSPMTAHAFRLAILSTESTGKTDRLGPNDSSTMPHSTTRLVSHAPSEFSEWKANSMPTNRTHSDSRKSMPSKQVHEADIAHQLIQDRGEERRADYTCELCTTHEDATNCRSHAIDAKHAGNAEAKAKACQRRDEGAESQHQRQECPTTAAEGPVTSSIETTKSTRSSRPTKHATSRADRSTGCTDCTTIPSPRSTNRLASTLHALHANSKLRPDTICTSGSPTNSTPLDPSSTIPYPRQTEDQSELEGHQQDHQAEPAQQRDH